jgi:1A family penicillin-binding protein
LKRFVLLKASWRLVRERSRSRQDDPPRRWLKRHWLLATVLFASTAGALTLDAWLYTCGFDGCPAPSAIRSYKPSEGGRVLDRNGRFFGRLALVRRVNVPLSAVPVRVREAFIATEDRRFASHGGLDWRAVGRAIVRNTAAFGVREGFSTITMQVARNTFLASRAPFDRSLGRKLLELRVARLLERNLPKDRILELYLNAIYLGNGVYGVEAASRDLFGKHVRDLTVAEGAMLAALPKGPSSYTPRRDQDRAIERRNLVLGLMQREGYLSDEEAADARDEALEVAAEGWKPAQLNESSALDAVRALVDSVLRARDAHGADVVVYTTLDQSAQRAADAAVRRRAAGIEAEAPAYWWANDGGREARGGVEGAMVALDPRTGDIRALVGGRRYVKGSFNRALSARRQPGSAFKPFVYAAALAAGFTPATVVEDEPVEVDQGHGDVWTPANYGDEYLGPVTLRRALMRSANAATVRVSRLVGERQVVAVAQRNGITSPLPIVPAVALGAVEVTPLELVTAYAPFANGGFRVRPRLVRRIERADGTLLWSIGTERAQVMDPRDAFQMTSMLRGVVDGGTGSVLRSMGVTGPVAGKTGTTNDAMNVWFVGYTPTVVAGFWFGYDTPHSLGDVASGGRLAAPAWAQFYLEGWRERGATWTAPAGLVARDIDLETGELAGEWCPLHAREWFRIGTEPTSQCHEHDGPTFDRWISNLENGVGRRLSSLLKRLIPR